MEVLAEVYAAALLGLVALLMPLIVCVIGVLRGVRPLPRRIVGSTVWACLCAFLSGVFPWDLLLLAQLIPIPAVLFCRRSPRRRARRGDLRWAESVFGEGRSPSSTSLAARRSVRRATGAG